MDDATHEIVSTFVPISLEALNGKAAMLERLDNKYIVSAQQLLPALKIFRDHFDVLEIEGKRSFKYATRYFDSQNYQGYFDHHQGRRKRCKIRIRDYVDAGFSYLEVKLKDKRSITIKKRMRLSEPLQALDDGCIDFIEASYRNHYGDGFGSHLRPAISMQYERMTLVAREGGERMTIDTGLEFRHGSDEFVVAADHFIIETKSSRGNGLADMIMRRYHLHPTAKCSKYCIGMAALGRVEKRNRFLPALKRLQIVNETSNSPAALNHGVAS